YFALRTRDEAGNWSPLVAQSQSTLCSTNHEATCGSFLVASNEGSPDKLPAALSLGPAVANPTRVPTSLSYAIPAANRAAPLDISLYDIAGRRVKTLVHGAATPGWFDAHWDLRLEGGDQARPGIYFVRMVIGGQHFTRTVVLVQ